jgi:hypothetical protein
MTAPISPRLVTAGLTELIAKQRAQREAEASQRLTADLEISLRIAIDAATSDHDRRAYTEALYLVAHPEGCHTAKDYPGWVPGCPTCPTDETTGDQR